MIERDESKWVDCKHLFPIFSQPESNSLTNEPPFVYLDTAATAQTPNAVIERMSQFYQYEYATVHRGVYQLSATATENMEKVRDQVQQFMGAQHREEIVFTKGTTEGINLVANAFLKSKLNAENAHQSNEIIVTEMEHHANLVPWQMLAKEYNAKVIVWRVNESGELDIQDLIPLLNQQTALLAVTHVSNVLGTVNDIATITKVAHEYDVPVLVDGAQAVMHQAVNVTELGCDFYVFSGHKLYGPTGIGALYANKTHLEKMAPWEGGGAMIDEVILPRGTSYNSAPWRFEAGTPNIAGILGLGAAITFIESLGFDLIQRQEKQLTAYALKQLSTIKNLTIFGQAKQRAGVVSFNLTPHHAYDVGLFLDKYGIAIRTGHHCAMPLLKRFNQTAVCRASIGCYTNKEDIDALVTGLKRISTLLG